MNDVNCPAQVIERALTPRGEIQLQKRGEYYEIISNGTFLMATYNGESERLLVQSALNKANSVSRVLIGGLGVGFSLQEALLDSRVEQVTIVEIEQKVIEWNKSILSSCHGHSLSDSRSMLVHADLISWISETDETFDLICLDIDNGPDWTVFDKNASLYHGSGLLALKKRLRPGGCVTFWSATPSPQFAETLTSYFDDHHVEIYAVPQKHGDPDFIFLVQT